MTLFPLVNLTFGLHLAGNTRWELDLEPAIIFYPQLRRRDRCIY